MFSLSLNCCKFKWISENEKLKMLSGGMCVWYVWLASVRGSCVWLGVCVWCLCVSVWCVCVVHLCRSCENGLGCVRCLYGVNLCVCVVSVCRVYVVGCVWLGVAGLVVVFGMCGFCVWCGVCEI